MAVTLQQIRAQPGYQGLSDDEIVKHVNSHGLDVEGYDPIQPPPEEAGAARSYVGIPLSKGVADIGGAAGYGLEAAGFEKAGRYLQDSNQQAQDMLTARQSKRAQEDAGKTLIDDNGNYGGYNLGTLAQDVFASAPGTLAMGMAGAPLAKVGTVASKALGIGEKLAKVAGSGVLGKGLAAGIDTAIGSAVGFGASEGVYSGASNAAQIQNEIRNTDINKMSEHPVFVETYHKETDPSLTQDQRLYQTRDILARKAGDDVFADTAIKTGLISMATGGGVFGMVRGNATRAASDVAEGVLTKAVKGFALEGLAQEAPQSALEQRTMNQVKQDYVNQGQDLNQGVLNAGIQGGIAGGVMGLFGGAGGNAQVTHKEADQKPTNNLDLNAETSGEQTPLGLPAPNKGLEFNRSSNVPKDIIVFDDGSQIDAHEFYQDRLAEHGNEEQAKNETYSALNGKPNPVIGIPELVFTADGTALNKQDLIKGFTNNGATEQHALDYIKKITETPVNERTETNLDPYRFLQERDAQDSKRNDERFNAQQSDLPETDNRGSAEYDNATTVPGGGAAETQGINPINPVNSATQPQQENINGGEKNTSENAYAKTGQERPLNQPAPDQSGANPAIQRTNEETDQAITGAQPEIPGAGQNPPGITEAGEQAKGEPIGSDSGLPDVYKPYQGKITKTTAKEGIDYSALDDAKDAKGNPTGWKIFRYENQVGILNPATKETYVYQTTPNSGSDFARAHSVMGNLAADLATKRADNLPQGELVSTPVYGNKNESTNATTKQSQEMAESADTSRKNANDNESAYVPTNEVDKDAPVLGARREQDQRKLTFGADHANVTEEPNQGQVNVESSKTEIKAQKEKSGTQAAINPIITRSKGAHLVAKMNEFNQANPNAIAA
ncbi:MAG: hypothetical protein Q8L15_18550, partial [Methylobacter sp.]|nr:hypothetical protein [Methylobacter sp.]